MRLSWDDSHDPSQNFVLNQSKVGSWGGSMFFQAYVGDAQFDTNSPADLRLYQGSLNLKKPKVGDEYTNYYYDKFSKTLNYSTIKVQEFLQWPGASRQMLHTQRQCHGHFLIARPTATAVDKNLHHGHGEDQCH